MDQTQAPILDALAAVERHPVRGFGAPGHHLGVAAPRDLRRAIGRRVFEADVLTPKGLDDRSERGQVVQRAHEVAAAAWQADFCRFVTGGTSLSLRIALAAVAAPGDTVLMAANVHKAERAHALTAGLDARIVPVIVDEGWELEHGVAPDALAAALDANPHARAFVLVSPSYYGVTSDIAALADLCHRRGIPLVCDAAWGGAYAFCEGLPYDCLAKGADIAVYSLHKTMGALSQGSALLARGGQVDLQRLWMSFELFETTSPSVPILASLDAARREHALRGERMWGEVLARGETLRRGLAEIAGVRVLAAADLPPGATLDGTKVLADVAGLGVAGYALDDWLVAEHGVSVGLSDARHLLATLAPGTTARDVRVLLGAIRDAAARIGRGTLSLPAPPAAPSLAALGVQMAMAGPDAFFAEAEMVALEEAAGRVCAELVAPAPPGVPRLVPGQRITDAHVAWLFAQRAAGVFLLDPLDPSQARLRVVR